MLRDIVKKVNCSHSIETNFLKLSWRNIFFVGEGKGERFHFLNISMRPVFVSFFSAESLLSK